MAEKIKNNIAYVFCAALGITNFIWFAIPYMTGINAYDIMSWGFDFGTFGFIMAAIIQIFALIGTVAALIIGGAGIALVIAGKEINFDLKKIAKYVLSVMASLSILMLVFVLVAVEFEFSIVSAGAFIWLVVCVGLFIADKVIGK